MGTEYVERELIIRQVAVNMGSAPFENERDIDLAELAAWVFQILIDMWHLKTAGGEFLHYP